MAQCVKYLPQCNLDPQADKEAHPTVVLPVRRQGQEVLEASWLAKASQIGNLWVYLRTQDD